MRLAELMCERREEIERAALTRVYDVADPGAVGDPAYAEGLREAVTVAVGYALSALEPPLAQRALSTPLPPQLVAQARHAARAGVSLDTVLRRYCAGHSLLGEFAVQEAGRMRPVPHAELRDLLHAQSCLADRMISAVAEEYCRQVEHRDSSLDGRRAESVRRLLASEPVDPSEIAYDLDAHHLGVAAAGPGAEVALRELAEALDRRLLVVPRQQDVVWAWLGGARPPSTERLQRYMSSTWPGGRVLLAQGEPGHGIEGWRGTHRQAVAALPVAQRGRHAVVRYADVALLATALGDPVLAGSLREIFLAPLAGDPDGAILRRTLQRYFACDRNGSSTAAALGVSRQTVNSRLHRAEECLGRQIGACAAEMETALRLAELDGDGC